ncbi:MAG: leucyl aminopeptidase family protein [Bifidobacteriaceae bacterium]|nr:leucyl aminopeptidase family protein [Bifidobacteriaceae bacterium]
MSRTASRSEALARALPEIRIVRGSVATSAQVRAAPGRGVLAIPVAPGVDGEEIQPRASTVDAAVRYGIDLAEYAERRRFDGAAGSALVVDLPVVHASHSAALPWHGLASTVILAGVGGSSADDLRRAGGAIARASAGRGSVVTTLGAGAPPELGAALAEGYLLGSHQPPKRPPASRPDLARHGELVLLGRYDAGAIAAARTAAWATWLARDLTAAPSNVKNPAWLADRIAGLAAAEGLAAEIWDERRLAQEGCGAILAVGAGSARPPRLAIVRYEPPEPAGRLSHVAVVGKGITYDTGGLDIKPRQSMESMKTDMAGAAAALAAVLGAARAALPLRVTAILPLAENAFGAASARPDDVVRVYGGATVEIGNTDAEGRLVLADALAYADREARPDIVLDIATLTGAARVALGTTVGAVFSNRDRLAEVIARAGEAAGEPWWRLPLAEDYRWRTRGATAQFDGAGRGLAAGPAERGAGAGGGAITAALFLEHFAGGRPWAHLDIAGPARAAAATDLAPKGATGFGTRTLLRALAELAAAARPAL